MIKSGEYLLIQRRFAWYIAELWYVSPKRSVRLGETARYRWTPKGALSDGLRVFSCRVDKDGRVLGRVGGQRP